MLFLHRSLFTSRPTTLIWRAWEVLCHESLPDPKHKKQRQTLLHLEEMYGSAMRKRFPPVEGSVIDVEEKDLANAVSFILWIRLSNLWSIRTTYNVTQTRPILGLARCKHCSDPREVELDSRRKFWNYPSWYDDQLRICDEMIIVIKRCVFKRYTLLLLSARLHYPARLLRVRALQEYHMSSRLVKLHRMHAMCAITHCANTRMSPRYFCCWHIIALFLLSLFYGQDRERDGMDRAI